jgi:hypothetical protein
MLVWPICVTGCLAGEEDRPTFRSILDKAAALGALRSMRDTLRIIESVRIQGDLGEDTWDVSMCLGNLGQKILLV